MIQLILYIFMVVFNPGPPIKKTEILVREFIECSEPFYVKKCTKNIYQC
ncbi:hypothetical protein SAMN05444483_101598 [Salegentibacter echinorum]|uniref:Uncharacterized protein n=1 Tax=Salegentibacter echinorum TaxID=1073325 RepID=A0A1M5CN94_SALEC|nr:hypothetical protein SAMN05444483_101598 [Salegentibacter echinorum]